MIRTFLVIAFLAVMGGNALAQSTPPPVAPAGMSQVQFDALVGAISDSVTEKLKAEGALSPPPAAEAKPAEAKPAPAAKGAKAPPAPKIVKMPPREGPDAFAVFIERAGVVLAAFPVMLDKLATIPGLLDRDAAGGGRSLGNYLMLLGAVVVVAVASEAALRQLLFALRHRLAATAPASFGNQSLKSLGGLALVDGVGVAMVWLICHLAKGAWFNADIGQDKFAAAVLTAIWEWRLFVLLFRIILRPTLPTARLCAAGDHEAGIMYGGISGVLLLMAVGRLFNAVLRAIGTPPEAVASFLILAALVYLAAFLWMTWASRDAARQWFSGLGVAAPLIGRVGRYWIPVAPVFLSLLAITLVYGAISGRAFVAEAMGLTLDLVVGVLLFETLMQAVVRRLDSQLVGRTAASSSPKLPDVVARCVRVAVLIGVIVTIVETWVVNVLGLVGEAEWADVTNSSRIAAVTLFVAFVLWELFKYATDPYMGRKAKSAAEAIASGDPTAPPASRISTMMPLLRRATAVLIALIALMISLQDFGINIAPLIAGASVFGIAISFGSQTLVKDIVSGLFYLSDDAFRVGEYIDAGKAKGTVEGFTLRSIKLRHQNGQVHTVPFGQLGQITNFSRDWITMKFNLRFARDTDLEKLRKAAKKIGTEIAEMPQFKDEVLAPFKMQGVYDIVESAILVRFKFTARPGNPSAIQREAVKRMVSDLPALGIEFAKEGAAVVLHTGAMDAPKPEAVTVAAPAPAPAPDAKVAAAAS